MSELKAGRIPEVNEFGKTPEGKEWVESSDFEIEFWRDYNGHWEPENINVPTGERGVVVHLLEEEFKDHIEWVSKNWPEVFFDPRAPSVAGVTRLRLRGTLYTLWHDRADPYSGEYKFKRTSFQVLERGRTDPVH
jgi:hypothetical protein